MNQCEEILTQIKKAFVGKKDVARKIFDDHARGRARASGGYPGALAKQRLP